MSITTIQKARAQLLVQHPFFATLLMMTPVVEDPEVPIAATDGDRIMVNSEVCNSLSVPVMKTIFAHEAAHIVFDHCATMKRNHLDRLRWNFATDYAINWMLKECGFEPFEGWLCDPRYAGLSAQQIYDLLESSKSKKGGGKGNGNGGGTMPSSCGQIGEDLRDPPPSSGDSTADAKRDRAVKQRIAQAANVARMAGKMPAALERLVTDMLEPVVPWPAVLREYMTRIAHDEESWARRNRRFATYLPARHSERMGEVVVIGDSSGSMVEDVLKGIAEVRSISEQLRPERIRLVWADAAIAGEQVFEEDEEVVPVVRGGGGTDMRIPLEYVEKYDPIVVILITDCYTPWPNVEPSYPLIVLSTTTQPCPIGQVIQI